MGVLPAVVGILTGNPVMSAWGAVFLSVAAGDLLVLFQIRDVRADALVRDHPTRFGCEIVGGPTA